MSSTILCIAAPAELVPLRVFAACSRRVPRGCAQADWHQMSEGRLWKELCLCILSSRTRFELALAAVSSLERAGLLRRLREHPGEVPYSVLEEALGPHPQRQGASTRSIPFWRTRAHQLVDASNRLYAAGHRGLKTRLHETGDAGDLRMQLMADVPGLGMKQASHFLQNVGFSDEFAVIDVHILSFLREELMAVESEAEDLDESLYLELEQRIQRLAAANGLAVGLLDRIVWAMRSG